MMHMHYLVATDCNSHQLQLHTTAIDIAILVRVGVADVDAVTVLPSPSPTCTYRFIPTVALLYQPYNLYVQVYVCSSSSRWLAK